MISPRLSSRIRRHHLPIGLGSAIAGLALYNIRGDMTRPSHDVIGQLSFASAYPALILLVVTLAIGPAKLLAHERLQVTMDLRRDFGIWAGIIGLFHAGIGQCVHLRGRPWLYYVYENWQNAHWQPLRHDWFGLANYTGLIATFLLLALLATSNDASLRKLGTPGWKQLQRWNYAIFALVAVHTLVYQRAVEKQTWFLGVAVVAMLIALVLQLVGWQRRRAMQA